MVVTWFLIFQGQYLQDKRWSYRRTIESYVKSERCHRQRTVHRKPCLYLEHRKLDYKKFNSLHYSPFGTMWQSSILCASKFPEKRQSVFYISLFLNLFHTPKSWTYSFHYYFFVCYKHLLRIGKKKVQHSSKHAHWV